MVKSDATPKMVSGAMQTADIVFGWVVALIILGATAAFMHGQRGFGPHEVGPYTGLCLFAIAFVVLTCLLKGEYREATTIAWLGVEVGLIASFCFLAVAKEDDPNLELPALLPAAVCLVVAWLFFIFASLNNRTVYPAE